jgi:molybdopterin molybdotransferase
VLKHLIDVDEALARLKAHIAPVTGIETVPLDRATSRVLARLVRSRAMAPGFDNAAMDGYALATHDLTGDGP